jgi:hypothetical protein
MKFIVFTARGLRDARILLSSDGGGGAIEIVIGGSYNPANGSSVSVVRLGVPPTSSAILEPPDWITATYTDPSGILSPDEDRFFWIYYDGWEFLVGKVRRRGPLCAYDAISDMQRMRYPYASSVNSLQGQVFDYSMVILWHLFTPGPRFTSLSVSTWESADSTDVTWSFPGMFRDILGPRLAR